MKNQLKTTLILIIGWSMIILGIIGLFLPVLQGILFILIGLFILAKRSRLAKELLDKLHHRYPGLSARLREAQHRGEELLEKSKRLFTKDKR